MASLMLVSSWSFLSRVQMMCLQMVIEIRVTDTILTIAIDP